MFTCMQDKYVIVMLCLLVCYCNAMFTIMQDQVCYCNAMFTMYARQVCYCNAMFTCMQDKYVIVMLCLLVCKTSMLL